MKKYILLFGIVISLFSCAQRSKKHIIIRNFPKSYNLKGEHINSFDDVLFAMSIFTTEKYIVLRKNKSDYFYSIYLKKDKSFKLELCSKGKGPSEFLAPLYCGQSKDNSFWIFDRATSMFSKIDIEKSIIENKTVISDKKDLKPLIKFQLRDVFIIDSTRFLFSEDMADCPYYIYDIKDKKKVKVENNYEFKIPKQTDTHEFLQKMTVYNKTKQKFASAYYCFPVISFSSLSQGTFTSILYGNKDIKLNNNNLEKFKDNEYIYDIKSTNDYVYCLYNNSENPSDSSSILVFDWNGTPVCKFNLSGKYDQFTIDPSLHKIYAINYKKESNIVTVFNISTLINL